MLPDAGCVAVCVISVPVKPLLVEASIRITKQKRLDEKYSVAEEIAEEKIIEAISPGRKKPQSGQEWKRQRG